MREVFIVSACRTAIGNFGGSLSTVSVEQLACTVVKEALKRAGIDGRQVDEVLIGCALQAGSGQNLARQASVNAGIPEDVPAMTINKVCGSGLRAVSMAAQTIIAGDNQVVVAGGAENMSQVPYLLKDARWGYKMGDGKVVDGILSDALTDSFRQYHMGITAENLALQYKICREEQDLFAASSQNKAEKAQLEGKFKQEIVSIEITDKKGLVKTFDTDEYLRHGTTVDKLSKLKPVFKVDGSITAGNASGINDGSAALILMSSQKVKALGIKPLAKIVSYASAGVAPEIMGIGPLFSTRKALARANMAINNIDLIELNEAFAVQAIVVSKELNFNMDKVNVNGGALALGHPIGASGARILVTLLNEMEKRNSRYGLASLCVGGGMGVTVIVERGL